MSRRTLLALATLATLAACSGSSGPSAKDPYAVIWTQVRFTQPPRDSLSYLVNLVRVNSKPESWGILTSHTAGTLDQGCNDFNGIPSAGSSDSLLVAVALTSTEHYPAPGADTVWSPTFQPLTGPTPDSAAVWKVVFTDTGTTVTEMPPGTVCGQ